MRALVTGGTGLLGRQLLKRLPNAVIASRDPKRASHELGLDSGVGSNSAPSDTSGWETVGWESAAGPPPSAAFSGVDAVFNLAGEPVAEGRWTEDQQRRIRDSRVVGTRNLVLGLATLARKPAVLVCASAVGYYGDRGNEELTETSPVGSGFLAQVCAEWEHEARLAETLGIRVVCVRIGLVLAPNGGALARMLPPFKLGLGARLGSGKQWTPWVHIDDVVGVLLHASRSAVTGALNAVSPAPVTNIEFTSALGHAVHRPAALVAPKAALRLAFGQMSEILVASQRVLPRATEQSGYVFQYPELNAALAAVLAK